MAPENPIWIEFARAMVPMMVPAAHGIADILEISDAGAVRVLDIAAGHGIFGITLAQRNSQVHVTAVDWAPVLRVAQENAQARGVADRLHALPGDAFAVAFGTDYDIALVTNSPPFRQRHVRRLPPEGARSALNRRSCGHSRDGPECRPRLAATARALQLDDARYDTRGRRVH